MLQDDRFETVAAAVEEGRVIFDNIRKFVFYLFSCNVAEVLVLLVAGLAGLPLPLAPLQLLWLNMVTDTFPGAGARHGTRRRDGHAAAAAGPAGSHPLGGVSSISIFWLRGDDYRRHARRLLVGAAARAGPRADDRVHDAGARADRPPGQCAQRTRRAGAAAGARQSRSRSWGVGVALALQLLTTTGPLARILDVAPLSSVRMAVGRVLGRASRGGWSALETDATRACAREARTVGSADPGPDRQSRSASPSC